MKSDHRGKPIDSATEVVSASGVVRTGGVDGASVDGASVDGASGVDSAAQATLPAEWDVQVTPALIQEAQQTCPGFVEAVQQHQPNLWSTIEREDENMQRAVRRDDQATFTNALQAYCTAWEEARTWYVQYTTAG